MKIHLGMPVKIAIQSPGLNLQTLLSDEALPLLLEMVQKHRVAPPPGRFGGGGPEDKPMRRMMRGEGGQRGSGGGEGPGRQMSVGDREPLNDAALAVKERVAGMTLAQIGQRAEGKTFPERVVLLTSFAETRPGALPVSRLNLRDMFVRLKDRPPANFGREVRGAWDLGWLDWLSKNEVAVSNAGWARVGELIGT